MNVTIPLPLLAARVHEACGPGAIGFAAMIAAGLDGNLIWIREGWRPEMPNPRGLAAFLDPSRLMIARTGNQTDTLAVAEEALRDGSVALVIAEISQPLDLREGRRLQLAAKTGGATGLCLIPEGAGSNASETRWYCRPVLDAVNGDSTLMRWEITKNKKGTIGVWHVRWDAKTHRIDVVSAPGI